MLRRLFFLFPDEIHAQRAVNQLENIDIPRHRVHAIARGKKLTTLPEASERQKNGTAFRIEQILWRLNLALFAVATLALIATLVASVWTGAILSLTVMLLSFFAGQQFVMRVPDVHLSEFTDALAHGEILLMIDVPVYRVAEIEKYIHHQYPEAAVGGTSWTVDAFGI